MAHRLSHEERQQILAVCNEPQYASLPPAQSVPALADQGEFLASESSFYRVLHDQPAGAAPRTGQIPPGATATAQTACRRT